LSCSIASGKKEGEMELVENCTKPMQNLHVDHFGPLEKTKKGFKYILVIIDSYTKYVWLYPCKSVTTEEVIKHVSSLFLSFGLPIKIISDRGTAFSSKLFAEFMKSNEIIHTMTAVASPWANGQVERVNRFLKSTLAKVIENPDEWERNLGKAQYVINNTVHKAINTTPSQLLLGFEQRNKNDEL